MKNQNVLIDLDDTLAHCNKYFDIVIDQFADQIETWFASFKISQAEVKQKQLEIDLASVQTFGFTIEHFPQSFVDTYEHFSAVAGRGTSMREMDFLRKLGSSVYEQKVEPYPHMLETLQALQVDGHRLYLYTGGDLKVQTNKVEQLNLRQFFDDRIFIRQHKTLETLEEILKEHRFERRETWMIGNSLRTDVIPAMETGINAIYIPAEREWEYNIMQITSKPTAAFLTLQSLEEVPEAIRSTVRNAQAKAQ